MRKWKKRTLATLAVLLVLAVPGYYLLAVHSPAADDRYALDIAKARFLGKSMLGERPVEVRYEHVMDFEFAEAMVMAGEPWRGTQIPVYSYQLVFPDGRTLVIDTAMNRAIAEPASMVPMYDDDAYQRMSAALEKAALIVLTHEHMDHVGGLAAQPNLAALLPALRLTEAQLANPEGMEPAVLPAAVMQGYQPLTYADMVAIAPGVVLIQAPGHTPGSQMVYVKRADDRELLFLGDVSWQMRNIHAVRERPLFMTLMIGEQRPAVLSQFKALNALLETEPRVRQVPGHDAAVMKTLSDEGLLTAGFR